MLVQEIANVIVNNRPVPQQLRRRRRPGNRRGRRDCRAALDLHAVVLDGLRLHVRPQEEDSHGRGTAAAGSEELRQVSLNSVWIVVPLVVDKIIIINDSFRKIFG